MRPFSTSLLAAWAAVAIASYGQQNASNSPDLGYDQLYKLHTHFYDRFMYPNNVKERDSINSTIFAENVQGRVSDTRNFSGRELNTEYIFGLFTPSDAVTIVGLPVGPYEIIQFAANKNIASASTRINYKFPSFGNLTLPVTIDTWMTWNDAHQITQYDVTFRWFAYLLQTLLLTVDKDLAVGRAKATASIAQSICATHTKHCTGANQQYDSPADCIDFLTKKIRVGDSFELGMNTLLCRNVHEIMVKFRPDVHCSHIGKTGGGQCSDDYTYSSKVTEKYFTNSAWVPSECQEGPK